MKHVNNESVLIEPYEPAQMSYWTKKWGVSYSQLQEAILETGSLQQSEIKNYLKSKPMLHSLDGIINYMRLCV
jgi:hypothetical protein